MTFIDRILRKPSSFFLWLFTSIIVTNTLLLVLTAGPAAPREQPGQPEEDPAGEQKQTKRQKEKKKTTTTVSKSRDELTRKELFDVLSDKGLYPDLDTTREQLLELLQTQDPQGASESYQYTVEAIDA